MELGLTSVTFRKLDYETVLSYCVKSGLKCIEWGSDVHVPQTDQTRAYEVKIASEKAGIRISSYGSYYKLCVHENVEEAFKPYLETAVILGAPVIRLWSGKVSFNEATREHYMRAINETRLLCDMAAREGITLAFEYHNNSLCDSGEHALKLLNDIDRDNFRLYFQQDSQISVEENLESLKMILPYVVMVHVAYSGLDRKNRRLDEGDGPRLWKEIINTLRKGGSNPGLLFEFLKDSSIDGLIHETRTLKNIIEEAEVN